MLLPKPSKYEWEGFLREAMKVRVLLLATEVIGEKVGRMLRCLKEPTKKFP